MTTDAVADAVTEVGDPLKTTDSTAPAAPAAEKASTTEVDAAKAATTEAKTADEEIVYDFKVPEGFEIGPEGDTLKALAKELKLPAEAAQKIADLAVAREQARVAAHVTQVQSWANELAADKEIGGAKTSETKLLAAKALALAPPGLREMLEASGLGNFPPMVRWARAVGKALSEDTHIPADQPAPSSAGMADRLYGNTKPRN